MKALKIENPSIWVVFPVFYNLHYQYVQMGHIFRECNLQLQPIHELTIRVVGGGVGIQ